MKTAIIILIAAGLTVSTAVTLIRAIGTVRRNRDELREKRAILKEGIAATAVINSIEQTYATLGGQPIVLLDLTVTKDEGELLHTVVETAIPIVHIPHFQKGSQIEVKYMTVNNEVKVEVVGAYVPGSA
ncbi:hypothetical protein [Paenibacillus humicola]|uniref:hypothetical protein n=1 Tax=Paenibacillus humicola TaxID=3110540 RepID=UPI00237C0BB2|nr:hypothetical protein [Paenibacillus humicola]